MCIRLCKMKGLYFTSDVPGTTFLFFFKDGRVISYNRYDRFNQHLLSFPELKVEDEKIHCFRGIYQVDIWDNIRIVIKSDFGKTEYNGFIRDDGTLDLFCRCPFTYAKKSATFVRCSEVKEKNSGKINQDNLN